MYVYICTYMVFIRKTIKTILIKMTFQPVKKTFPFGRLVQTAAGSSTSVIAALIIRWRSLCTHKETRDKQ